MNERKTLSHIRSLMKARGREDSSGSTEAKVAASQWDLVSEERYKIQLHDQIRLTLTERGWVPVITGKDDSLVGWTPTPTNTFKTPEEAVAYLRKYHDI